MQPDDLLSLGAVIALVMGVAICATLIAGVRAARGPRWLRSAKARHPQLTGLQATSGRLVLAGGSPAHRASTSINYGRLTLPLDVPLQPSHNWHVTTTGTSSETRNRVELLQGTLDLIVLRALDTMGPQHAYGLATRLEQVSEPSLVLNQGTLYPALVRLEQHGWIRGTWQRTVTNREAKYYAITKAGVREMQKQTERWRRLAGLVERLLLNDG